MRTLNTLTQNLIESLTQLLQKPEEDALESLKVCAPVTDRAVGTGARESGGSP